MTARNTAIYITEKGTISVDYKEVRSQEDVEQFEEKNLPDNRAEIILRELEKLSTAKQIYEYMEGISGSGQVPTELLNILQKHMKSERLYGNAKEDSVRTYKQFYGIL